MKAILMSIKPIWVAKILNGEKTIEIRKRFPSDYRGWVYIYCTKDKNNGLYWTNEWLIIPQIEELPSIRNGKVVARFWCDEIEYIEDGDFKNFNYTSYCLDSFRNTISTFSCLSIEQINAYLKGKDGYAIHISKLEIFDKPKELSKFSIMKQTIPDELCEYCTNYNFPCKKCKSEYPLAKAPQSWCYIEI